jgi:cyclopropane-fatty-acyl-phospholipid synthase
LGDYFKAVAGLMSPDALFLNAGIARPETTSDDDATRFLRKFVFPGGEVPYLSDAIRAAETAGLEVLDLENLRPHYAMTCASWLQRLQAHRDMCLLVVNSRVYRTWLLYLAGSAVAFECGEEGLYHMLLAKRRGTNARKLTRASMYSSIASPDGQEATRPLA